MTLWVAAWRDKGLYSCYFWIFLTEQVTRGQILRRALAESGINYSIVLSLTQTILYERATPPPQKKKEYQQLRLYM